QTLRRKGLGLESQELELELEQEQDPVAKAQRLSEGRDLSAPRPRFYVTYSSSPPTADAALGSASSSPQSQGRLPAFKPAPPKPPGRSPGPLPPGLSYPLFPTGSLNRALATKTPPPLYLGTEARRGEGHGSLASGRSGGSAARALYPTLQTLSPVLTSGSSGIPGHGLTGFSFLTSSQAEFGAGEAPPPPSFLQPCPTAWQHPRDMAALGLVPQGTWFPCAPPVTHWVPSSQMGICPLPSARLAQSWYMGGGSGELQPRDDYAKGYPYSLATPRPLAEEQRLPMPTRRAQVMDAWQR
ncbi:MEF2B factor, partial [Eubucco bourcierii]|nr:MEF2B factor [Eubucco bourcierii]